MGDHEREGYPPALAELLRGMPMAPLGPGEPIREMRGQLETIASEFASAADRAQAAACRAGLWLAFNFLDESHTISQEIQTVEGSYCTLPTHRREPDAGNAAYWFRRFNDHSVFEPLRLAAAELAAGVARCRGLPSPAACLGSVRVHRPVRVVVVRANTV